MFQVLFFVIISCNILCKNHFKIYIRSADETVDPATQHIILKIVGFKEFIMVNNNYMGLVFYHSLYFSDQEAQIESH